ncbi:MAG: hypothetical protein A2Y14_05665 [Verrucomicrobia bacterium GWF2_51_19]|nr:MAG: hypothetical protein A2Y14_05665 [Verrucomicrobia bacterium GWF2_51_19]HCJ12139.1 hypothetical protein [Opitutae bacterium]
MNEPAKVLEVCKLVKSYHSLSGDVRVLRGIHFTLFGGDTVSIRGESGCGKTTLLNSLSLLDKPDSGEVFWRDVEYASKGNDRIAKQRAHFIGFIFQFHYLVPELTVLENVLLAVRIGGERVTTAKKRLARDLLTRVGLQKRMDALPFSLSGGEAQRVAIARALINQPPLIIADEPTGNLDEDTAESIFSLLMSLCEEHGTSLILVTHNPNFAQRTRRQFSLHHGKLEEITGT